MQEPSELQQVELSIAEAKRNINKMNALIRLSNNKDYALVFLDGFFREFAIDQVMMKAAEGQQREQDQKDILRNIDAIGTLRLFMHNIIATGRASESAIAEDEQTREELHLEEGAA